jgi:hypothetical protein
VTLSKDVRKVVDSLDTLDTSADLHLKFKKGTPLKFKRKVRRYFKKYIMPDMQKVVREKFMNVLVFGSRERPEL